MNDQVLLRLGLGGGAYMAAVSVRMKISYEVTHDTVSLIVSLFSGSKWVARPDVVLGAGVMSHDFSHLSRTKCF